MIAPKKLRLREVEVAAGKSAIAAVATVILLATALLQVSRIVLQIMLRESLTAVAGGYSSGGGGGYSGGGYRGGYSGGGGGGQTCYTCGGFGHLSRDCTQGQKCYNCK